MQDQLPFEQKIDKVITLGEVERRLAKVMAYPPARTTLIRHIEGGILIGGQDPDNGYYYVWESSLMNYITRKIKTPEQLAA